MTQTKRCMVCEGEKVFDGEVCCNCNGTGFEIDYTDAPVCPACGHPQKELTDLVFKEGWVDEAEAEVSCETCGQLFEVQLHVTHSFSTVVPDHVSEKGGSHDERAIY